MGGHQTLYGKLNFKNQADKEVKISELSGIGEPTMLSPNYVSTFFVKSPKVSATFRAEDPVSREEYLLNGKDRFEIKLSENPKSETDVIISKDTAAKRAHEVTSKYSDFLCFVLITFDSEKFRGRFVYFSKHSTGL